MKNLLFIVLTLFLVTTNSCKKEQSDNSGDTETNQVPVVTTDEATYKGSSGVYCRGDIVRSSLTITEKGFCVSLNENPTTKDYKFWAGEGMDPFGLLIKVEPGKKYYVRAYAISSAGIGYGKSLSFQTPILTAPTINIDSEIYRDVDNATIGIDIVSDGGSNITEAGICYSANPNPTLNDLLFTYYGSMSLGKYTCEINKLLPNTSYYVKAYVKNSVGTTYSSELKFTTKDGVIDVSGNVYHVVKIGDQIWMAENLKVTCYNNGDVISSKATANSLGALYLYKYEYIDEYYVWRTASVNVSDYGYLYNWYAVNDSRKIAPVGWHVATDADWNKLINYVGGYSIAGGKLKQIGWKFWDYPNIGATDDYGFTAIGGGAFDAIGYTIEYTNLNKEGYWWTSTSINQSAYCYNMSYNSSKVIRDYMPKSVSIALSVRCIKD